MTTMTATVSNGSLAAETSGNRPSLDQLLDDATRVAPQGAPRRSTASLPWNKICGYYIDKNNTKAQRECIIRGDDVVVHFRGSFGHPFLSIDQRRTTATPQVTYGTGVQIDDFPPHEWWPGTDSSIYKIEVEKVMGEMTTGEIIRYGRVNDHQEWYSTKERSLDGFSGAYKEVEDWFRAGESSEAGHHHTSDKP